MSTGLFISDGEQVFIEAMNKAISIPMKYTCKTQQFCIWSHEANQSFFYDACCTKKNKIVEYHGDYWHARPSHFDADFIVKQNGMMASEIWARDSLKEAAAKNRGFDVYVVWESDFIRDGISKELIEWLNN